jgi:hypothetical protein
LPGEKEIVVVKTMKKAPVGDLVLLWSGSRGKLKVRCAWVLEDRQGTLLVQDEETGRKRVVKSQTVEYLGDEHDETGRYHRFHWNGKRWVQCDGGWHLHTQEGL